MLAEVWLQPWDVDPWEILAGWTARPAWMLDALCAEPRFPTGRFFPERGGSGSPGRRVCADCLVRGPCLAFALERGDDLVGIWGGTTATERRAMRAAGIVVDVESPPPMPVRFGPRPKGGACEDCGRVPAGFANDRLRGGLCSRCYTRARRERVLQVWATGRTRTRDRRATR